MDNSLPCVLSRASEISVREFFEVFTLWVGFVALILHVVLGLISELLDFEVSLSSSKSCAK